MSLGSSIKLLRRHWNAFQEKGFILLHFHDGMAKKVTFDQVQVPNNQGKPAIKTQFSAIGVEGLSSTIQTQE